MELLIRPEAVDFVHDGGLAGRYVYSDAYKPYLHPLNTPAGRTLSLLSPHDHRHHKGLMYALRAGDVNFWEERPTGPDEAVGMQRHDGFARTAEEGDRVGFDERLTWLAEDGTRETFAEERTISCGCDLGSHAYEWRWSTRLEATRDVELVMSQWSVRRPDRGSVNYHGLGIRLRREFGCTGGNRLSIDGTELPFADGMGRAPTEVEFRGSIDGTWPVRMAGVRFGQGQGNALFVMDSPFAFMGIGPTNLAPLTLRAGDTLTEEYTISVFDCPVVSEAEPQGGGEQSADRENRPSQR